MYRRIDFLRSHVPIYTCIYTDALTFYASMRAHSWAEKGVNVCVVSHNDALETAVNMLGEYFGVKAFFLVCMCVCCVCSCMYMCVCVYVHVLCMCLKSTSALRPSFWYVCVHVVCAHVCIYVCVCVCVCAVYVLGGEYLGFKAFFLVCMCVYVCVYIYVYIRIYIYICI